MTLKELVARKGELEAMKILGPMAMTTVKDRGRIVPWTELRETVHLQLARWPHTLRVDMSDEEERRIVETAHARAILMASTGNHT